MKKMKKLLLVLLCAITVGSALEARRSGGGSRSGGHRSGFRSGGHRSGGFRRGGHRGGFRRGGWGHRGYWGRGYRGGWGGGFWGRGYRRPLISLGLGLPIWWAAGVSDPALADFINVYGRNPYNNAEFCNWIISTGRTSTQCSLY